MADIARLGFSVDTSGLVRAERAIESLDRAARGLRDIGLRVDVSGAAEAMRQLDRLDGRNIAAQVRVDVSGADEAMRQLDRLDGRNISARVTVDVSGADAAVRELDRLAANRTTRIDVTVAGIDALRSIDNLVNNRSIRIDANITGINEALRDLDRLSVNRTVRIDASTTGISEALRDIDRIAVNRSIRIDATVTGINEALRDINRLSGGARSVRVDVAISGVDAAVRGLLDIERLAVNRTVRIDINTGDIRGAISDLERLAREARDAAAQINGLGANVNVTSGAFGGLKTVVGAVLGILAGGQIAQGINDVIQYNAEINLLTQSLGVSRDALQVWGNIGKSAGVDIANIFKDVNEKIAEFASTGGGEAVDVFKRLKLDVKDFIALSPDQQVLKITKAMSEMKDMSRGEKIFLLESLADDSSKLLPLLENNAAKLREIDQLTRSSGAIITAEQNANLTEAKGNLDKLALSMKGAGNAAADVGSQIVNAFAGDAMDAVSGLDDAIYRQAENAQIMGASFVEAYRVMSEHGTDHTDTITSSFDDLTETMRIGWSYWPVWSAAAYVAIDKQGRAWIESARAQFNSLRSTIRSISADVVEEAGGAFDWIVNIAKKGGNNLFGGTAAPSTGTFAPYVAELRGAATYYDDASKKLAHLSEQSGYAAERAINSAAAYQVESEQRRALNVEMGIAERQFAALGSGLDSAGKSGQQFYVNQEKVNEALKDGDEKAKKAAASIKELSAPWLSGSVAFKSEIEAAASRFGVDSNLVKAVIQQETGFLKDAQKQLKAVSPAGAKGIMQVMPGTAAMVAKEIGLTNYNLFKAADNITLGTAYLSQQLAKYNGDISKVAAAYNAGPGAVDKYAGIPPYKETQGYVQSVLGYYAELTKGVDNSGKAQIKSILEVEKTRLEAAKKIANEKVQLQAEVEKAKTSTLGGYAIDLKVQGVGPEDATEMVALKSAAALAQLQRQAQATRMEAVLSKEAFREWQLVNQEGLTPSVAAAQAALEQQSEKFKLARDIGNDFAEIMNNEVSNSLKDIAHTGNRYVDLLIDKLIEASLEALNLQKSLNFSTSGSSGSSGSSGGGGGLGSIFSGIGNWIGNLFGGGRANGGAVYSSKIHPVNERNIPEVVTTSSGQYLMNTDGRVSPLTAVTPMAAAGGGGSNISVVLNAPLTIDARGADDNSLAQLQGQLQAFQQRIYRDVPALVRQAQINARRSPSV